MCGICGLMGSTEYINIERLRAMTEFLEHRGPDEEAFYTTSSLAFGFRRLAIVDREGSHQPLCNENKHIHVIFNGEIYNYPALREELIHKGHHLLQAGDGEVIAHLYEEYGLAFPTKLRGAFAIALWDDWRKRLVLVRDRLGVKPLYIRLGEGSRGLAFASELRALLIGEEKPDIDVQALDHYLSYRYVPAPKTIFKGIFKIEPGSMLSANFSKWVQLKKIFYWHPSEETVDISFNEASEGIISSLQEALKIRWPDEVPAGYFFSGGLDSAGLVGLHNALNLGPARTYAVGFERPQGTRDFRYFSELDQAKYSAKALGAKHSERVVTLLEVKQKLKRILTGMDEPIADPTAIPLYFLSEFAASQGEKVVFSGEGADELFGGYSTYYEPVNYRNYHKLPNWVQATAQKIFPRQTMRFTLPLEERYFGVGGLLRANQKQELYSLNMLSELLGEITDFPARHWLKAGDGLEEERMLRFDLFSWLPENTLMKTDKMTMKHSLEVRLPYLDHQLVELGMSLPLPYKIGANQNKAILRSALASFLPQGMSKRPKNGFPVPITAWLAEELNFEMRSVLLDPQARLRDFILPSKMEEVLTRPLSHKTARLIWALYSLEIYLEFALSKRFYGVPKSAKPIIVERVGYR